MELAAKTRHVGLARALSKLGYCSRTQAGELIRAGRVRLNGAVRRDPEAPARMEADRIEVDGAAIGARERIYLMMNKPRGLVTTASDEQGRPTVYSVLEEAASGEWLVASKARSSPHPAQWVAPVGRLDKASEGLLLFTNDSEWAAHVTDPASHLDKTYHVQIAAQDGEAISRRLVQGLLMEGELLRAKQARVLRAGDKNTWLEIVLDEGKNRQIRRMLEQLGIEVLRLVRVAIGPLQLGDLAKGKFRALDPVEKRALYQALGSHSSKNH